MIAKIQKWGNSHGIRLPKSMLDALDWNVNEEIEIENVNNSIVITQPKVHKRKSIAELFEGYEGDYSPEIVDWGDDVGAEKW